MHFAKDYLANNSLMGNNGNTRSASYVVIEGEGGHKHSEPDMVRGETRAAAIISPGDVYSHVGGVDRRNEVDTITERPAWGSAIGRRLRHEVAIESDNRLP